MCWTCGRPDTGRSGGTSGGQAAQSLWPVSSPSRWNQFRTKELNRQEPKGGEARHAVC
jgi:hypothetical protein